MIDGGLLVGPIALFLWCMGCNWWFYRQIKAADRRVEYLEKQQHEATLTVNSTNGFREGMTVVRISDPQTMTVREKNAIGLPEGMDK